MFNEIKTLKDKLKDKKDAATSKTKEKDRLISYLQSRVSNLEMKVRDLEASKSAYKVRSASKQSRKGADSKSREGNSIYLKQNSLNSGQTRNLTAKPKDDRSFHSQKVQQK